MKYFYRKGLRLEGGGGRTTNVWQTHHMDSMGRLQVKPFSRFVAAMIKHAPVYIFPHLIKIKYCHSTIRQ